MRGRSLVRIGSDVGFGAVAPVLFDPHVCHPPSTAGLIGREMDFECRCGQTKPFAKGQSAEPPRSGQRSHLPPGSIRFLYVPSVNG
jgi:hypothetical protein